MRPTIWIISAIMVGTCLPVWAEVECRSADVYDAGYVLRFNLESYTPGPNHHIQVKIFESVPLWNLREVYSGNLFQLKSNDRSRCEFLLSDGLNENGNVQIYFRRDGARVAADMIRLNGIPPARFSRLICDATLTDKLFSVCAE